MKAPDILATIGGTPHIRVNRLFGSSAQVWIKSERANPGGSIKDRIGLAMVEDAEAKGTLRKGATIIEQRTGLKVACLEEVAYRNKWITAEQVAIAAEPMKKNAYGQYLLDLIK